MKKTLIVISGVVLGIVLVLLLLIITANTKGFQQNMLKRYTPYNITFDSIKINPFGSITVKDASLNDTSMAVSHIFVTVKFKLFKALSREFKSIVLKCDQFVLKEGTQDAEKPPLDKLSLPELDIPEITIKKIQLDINNVIIEGTGELEEVSIAGNIIDSKPNIFVKTGKIFLLQEKITGELSTHISGDLNSITTIAITGNVDYETYCLSIDTLTLEISLKEYSFKVNSWLRLKNLGELLMEDLEIRLDEKGAGLNLTKIVLNTDPISFEGAHLKKFKLDMDMISANFELPAAVSIKKANVYADIEASYISEAVEINKALFTISGGAQKDVFSFEINSTAQGSLGVDPFETGILIAGKVLSLGKENKYELSPEMKGYYKNNEVQLTGEILGDQEKFHADLKIASSINETLEGILVDIGSELVSEIEYSFTGDYSAVLEGGVSIRKVQSSELFLQGNEIILAIKADGNAAELSYTFDLGLDELVKFASTGKFEIPETKVSGAVIAHIDAGKLPLKDLGVKDVDIESGFVDLDFDRITYSPENGFTAKGAFSLNEFAIIGPGFEDISPSLLYKNRISVDLKGDIEPEVNIVGKVAVNDSTAFISADCGLSYSMRNITAAGKLSVSSPGRYRPLYQQYLIRGKANIPFEIALQMGDTDSFTALGSFIAQELYVSSADIRINSLSGELPFKYDSAIAADLSLPEPLERPLETLSNYERSKHNLTISRLYIQEYYAEDIKMKVRFDNYLDLPDMYFRFLGGNGIVSLTATTGLEFWLKMNFTNGYAYNLLKETPKNYSKEDSLINIHASIFGEFDDLNGFLKMPGLGRSVLLNVLQAVDPEEKDPQIESLKNKVKLLGYYPETIELTLDGSTASVYVPLKKKGFNPINIPFSIQNIPIKKLMNSMMKE